MFFIDIWIYYIFFLLFRVSYFQNVMDALNWLNEYYRQTARL